MRTRLFFAVYGAANFGLLLYGVSVLVSPDILLKPFLLHVYRFPVEAATATVYMAALFRLLGYFNIIPGVLGLFLLRRMTISTEKWMLAMVIGSTVLAYLGPIVFDNTVGSIGFFEVIEHILFLFVIILGIIMWKGWVPRKRL